VPAKAIDSKVPARVLVRALGTPVSDTCLSLRGKPWLTPRAGVPSFLEASELL